jgi:hypothetical protein
MSAPPGVRARGSSAAGPSVVIGQPVPVTAVNTIDAQCLSASGSSSNDKAWARVQAVLAQRGVAGSHKAIPNSRLGALLAARAATLTDSAGAVAANLDATEFPETQMGGFPSAASSSPADAAQHRDVIDLSDHIVIAGPRDSGPLSTPGMMETYVTSGPGIDKVTVREAARFTIEVFDQKGVLAPIGPQPFFVSVHGVARCRARVVERSEASITIEWKPTCSGQYKIAISRFGLPLPDSPFTVHAANPEPFPLNCVLRGGALTTAVSREMNKFEVEFKDKLGVVTHAVELDVFVEPVPLGSPRPQSRNPPSPELISKERESPQLSDRDSPQVPKSLFRELTGEQGVPAFDRRSLQTVIDERLKALEYSFEGEGSATFRLDGKEPRPTTTPEPPTYQVRQRRIRVKVGDKPLVVRRSCELDSENIGLLMPGAIATVIEERITPGNVRACISLDLLGKEDSQGIKSERGVTFRGENSTYRSDGSAFSSPPLKRKAAAERSRLKESDRNDYAAAGGRSGSASHRSGVSSHRCNSAPAAHRSGARGGGKASTRKSSSQVADASSTSSIAAPNSTVYTDGDMLAGLSCASSALETIPEAGSAPKTEELEEAPRTPLHGAAHARLKHLVGTKLQLRAADTLAEESGKSLNQEPEPDILSRSPFRRHELSARQGQQVWTMRHRSHDEWF